MDCEGLLIIWNKKFYICVCAYTYMVKVISLSDEAYRRLKSLKHEKSFSDVVIELVKEGETKKKRKSVMDFVGIWADDKNEIDKIKRIMENDRKKFKLREIDW